MKYSNYLIKSKYSYYILKSKYSYHIFSRENNQFLQDAEKARKMAEEICW